MCRIRSRAQPPRPALRAHPCSCPDGRQAAARAPERRPAPAPRRRPEGRARQRPSSSTATWAAAAHQAKSPCRPADLREAEPMFQVAARQTGRDFRRDLHPAARRHPEPAKTGADQGPRAGFGSQHPRRVESRLLPPLGNLRRRVGRRQAAADRRIARRDRCIAFAAECERLPSVSGRWSPERLRSGRALRAPAPMHTLLFAQRRIAGGISWMSISQRRTAGTPSGNKAVRGQSFRVAMLPSSGQDSSTEVARAYSERGAFNAQPRLAGSRT